MAKKNLGFDVGFGYRNNTTHEQFLQMTVGLGLGLFLCIILGLEFCVFTGLASTTLFWEECLRNYLYCVEWNIKP